MDDEIKNDPRFSHIATDPVFRPIPSSKRKVSVDSRFQSVFTDRRFSHKTDVDKRGRPVLAASSRHVMQRFYQLPDQQTQTEEPADQHLPADLQPGERNLKLKHKLGSRAVDKSLKDLRQKRLPDVDLTGGRETKITNANIVSEKKHKSQYSTDSPQNDVSHGLDSLAPENEVSSNSSSEDDDSDDELPEFSQHHVLEETEVDHKWNELQEDAPTVAESTNRLAVCNMDWDFVKAQDLFVLFKSFVPDGGNIKSVTIYPSEFGKERMAEEARLGPKEMRQQSHCGQLISPVSEKGRKKKQAAVDQQQVKRSMKHMEATNTEKLREYQLNRLRYYFAVVICDCAGTAENVYNECDGREYLLSSVRLDLRFIPDSMTFDDLPKDVFSEENSILEYEPNRFSSTALCQAKVDVTWDETDFDRLSRKLAGLQHKALESIVEENKYSDIIAPPESDSDEDVPGQPDWLKQATDGGMLVSEEEKIALYRRLLVDSLNDDGEEGDKGADDKEFVWQPGLKSSLVKRMQKKENKEAEAGVVSEYLEKKREKKKRKKDERMKKTDTCADEEIAIDIVGGSQVKSVGQRNQFETKSLKRKKKGLVLGDKQKESGTADLELLVMDGSSNTKSETKDDARTSKRRKRSKKKRLLEDSDDTLVDVSDSRFAALYTSHHYHIDPSAAQFKKTKSMSALVNEQIKRRGHYGKSQLSATGSVLDTQPQQTSSSKSLSLSLVESLKLKMRK